MPKTLLRNRQPWRGRFVFIAVVILVAVVGSVVDWKHLSVDALDGALNDQVGYISVARDFADHGTLDSKIVYPLLLRQEVRRNSLYMPGYFWVLGAFFKSFGYSAAISRIPSLLALLLACYLVYWIASRLYGDESAIYAVTLFAVAPLILLFAFTAMLETALVAAGLAALAIFLRANEGRRPWVAPIAVLLPFLFRETGIIVGVVMLAVMAGAAWRSPERKKRVLFVCLSAVLMVLLCGAVLKSPIGDGRPSLWKANILIGRNYEILYGDAFATDLVPSQPGDWMDAIQDKFLYSAHVLVKPQGESGGIFEQSVLWFVLSGIPLGMVLGFWKRDFFALGTSAAVVLLFLGCLALYPVWGYRGVRVLLILYPLVAMLWGSVIARLLRNSAARMELVPAILLFVLGGWGAIHMIRAQEPTNRGTRENTEFMESVVQGDRRMLISPFWLSFDYVNKHYPQYWAFLPSNCETMRLLDSRYQIGTMIVPEPELQNEDEDVPRLPPNNATCGTALKFAEERELNGMRFWIFRRR